MPSGVGKTREQLADEVEKLRARVTELEALVSDNATQTTIETSVTSKKSRDTRTERLVRETRLAAIDQLSASIAHELRNPLGAMRNAVYLLKKRLFPPQDRKIDQYLNVIEDEVKSASKILSSLREMTQDQEPQRQDIEVSQLVQEAYQQTCSPSAIELVLSFSPEPFVVWADPGQLRQVLRNLFMNALQAMQGQGAITVTGQYEKGFANLVIQDSGCGVPPEYREQIFEPLFTTKATGAGLGLAICKKILERHGGTIELVERGDTGTAFRLNLALPEDTRLSGESPS